MPRKSKRLSALLLLVPLQACSTSGPNPEPQVAGTAEQICKDWPIIRPSKSKDKISEGTARQIADANIANETWCKRG